MIAEVPVTIVAISAPAFPPGLLFAHINWQPTPATNPDQLAAKADQLAAKACINFIAA